MATHPRGGSLSAPRKLATAILVTIQASQTAAQPSAAAIEARLAELPSPKCTDDGIRHSRGRVRHADFYAAMNGFAAQADTRGGLGQRYFEVTSAEDSSPGLPPLPGSLRAAVMAASEAGGGWIGFAPGLFAKRISLKAPLRLSSNITIDGGCQAPTVEGPRQGSLLYLRSVESVVISRLSLQHAPLRGEEAGKGDCITVSHGSDRVWIVFNRLRACADGLVDVTQNSAARVMRVTIAHNRFADHDKAMIVAGDTAKCDNSLPDLRATLYRNLFLGTAQRHPRVSGSAFAHVVENVVAFRPYRRPRGSWSGAYGSLATAGGMLLVERTLYAPLFRGVPFRLVAADAAGGPCGGGAARVSALTLLSPGTVRQRDPERVALPPYKLALRLDMSSDPLDAAAKVAASSGPSGWLAR